MITPPQPVFAAPPAGYASGGEIRPAYVTPRVEIPARVAMQVAGAASVVQVIEVPVPASGPMTVVIRDADNRLLGTFRAVAQAEVGNARAHAGTIARMR